MNETITIWMRRFFLAVLAASTLVALKTDAFPSFAKETLFAQSGRKAWVAARTSYYCPMPPISSMYEILDSRVSPGEIVYYATWPGETHRISDLQYHAFVSYVLCPQQVYTKDTLPLREADWVYAVGEASDLLRAANLLNQFEPVPVPKLHSLFRHKPRRTEASL